MTFFYYPINKCAYEQDEPWFEPLATYKKSTSFEVLILNLGRTTGAVLLALRKETAPSIKRYKTSDRSELANVMRLRARRTLVRASCYLQKKAPHLRCLS